MSKKLLNEQERDFIGYGQGGLKNFKWPDGARIAVQFVVNYEEGGENCILNGDTHSEAFLSEIVGAARLEGVRHMNMESIYEYGARAGFWRLHRMFSEREVIPTVYAVATAMNKNEEAINAMLKSNWEVASHGYKWIDYQYMPEADEREHTQKAIEIHQRITGEKPRGWYTGRTGPNSRKIVFEELPELLYNSDSYADDLPYWVEFNGDSKLIIPYTLDSNDMRFASAQGFNSGDQFYSYLSDAFDVLYEEGADSPKMLNIGLHCRLVGRPGRAKSLAKFIDYVLKHDNIWLPTREQIANHFYENYKP